ncbi:MAG: radical SAM family heme chaperone HemW [Pseudomonadota bacterium]
MTTTARTPLGLYIHWPFCEAKCPYCDFNSHVRHGGVDQAPYRAAFAREIVWTAARAPQHEIASIFFGGGTPSLMTPETVDSILTDIARHWPLAADIEITLEANPSSVEADRFAAYAAAGVNRVSLGVQALDDAALKMLGRLHSAAEARAALDIAAHNFKRVSADLIYARPDQTPDAWQRELREALSLPVGHLSLYQLTIEAGTPFHALHQKGKLSVPGEGRAAELFALTQDVCREAGLPAYEISNHAREGEACRHNLIYWRYYPYAGVGPGAHGRLDLAGVRTATEIVHGPEDWLAQVARDGSGIIEREPLSVGQMADEMLLMGARLVEGIDTQRMTALTGMAIAPRIERALISNGDVVRDGSHLRLTERGRTVLNEVVVRLSSGLVKAHSEASIDMSAA